MLRTEKERDEARQAAADGALKVQDLEKKLIGASWSLSGWRSGNGKNLVGPGGGQRSSF